MNDAFFWQDRECPACGHIGPGRFLFTYAVGLFLALLVLAGAFLLLAMGFLDDFIRTSGGVRSFGPLTAAFLAGSFIAYSLTSPSAVRCPKCGGIYS
ncbi:MAG: hypothetical protein EOP11_04720 [Proteobacteria bacterium]|nr:MAG: hypothetical protein EOP11_04720 [Pseudomonadota bacterium]